jgi:uncharacterized protein YndB with AHSA1/START domain
VTGTEYSTSLHIDAEPAMVFPYLTDPTLMTRWMGDWADLDPTAGGRFVVDITGVPIRGHYLEIEPPHRLVFSWGAAGNDLLRPDSTTVEITLRPDGTGTLLELVHRGLPPEEQPQHGIGWTHFLKRLAIAGTGHDPGPDPWATASGPAS